MTNLDIAEALKHSSAPEITLTEAKSLAAEAESHAFQLSDPAALTLTIQQLRALLRDTPWAALLSQYPGEKVRLLAHAMECNRAAVQFVVTKAKDPLVLAYAAALLTQKSLYTFRNPKTGVQTRDLTSAKRLGAFFTPPHVAVRMAQLGLEGRKELSKSLEPAAGTGMLTAALLVEAARTGVQIGHVEAWELSPYLAEIANQVLKTIVAMLGTETQIEVKAADAISLFSQAVEQPDLVLLNPPYGRVKYLRSEATNVETRAVNKKAALATGHSWVQETVERYTPLLHRLNFRLSGLDHQRVFMAASFALLPPTGRLVCISPSSWTSGKQAEDLRRLLLPGKHVSQIILYPENMNLFPTVNQPTAVTVAERSEHHESIRVSQTSNSTKEVVYEVPYEEILDSRPGPDLAIPLVEPSMRAGYKRLREAVTLGEQNVINARGELDLSLDGWMLTDKVGGRRVIRGDHLSPYRLSDPSTSSKLGYISEGGEAELQTRRKWPHSQVPRIVGRQVSYMGKNRRLTFAIAEAGSIVSNSCNYLVVEDSVTRNALLAYLNSAPAEWWFRVHSSNNHVSNGEIDSLPWPLKDESVRRVLAAAATIIGNRTADGSPLSERVENLIDAVVCFGFNLSSIATTPLLSSLKSPSAVEETLSLLEWFRRWGLPEYLQDASTWFQHSLNTLSALDLEMIQAIPIGGNWRDIPESVPSQRVKQIREMSEKRGIVRTTYYGRLRIDQPSYTIATYYNRPGNGTNIHPFEDRTISHREAARFQSFPDSYGFSGGDGPIRKQIGNAVPPLLAHGVASSIFKIDPEVRSNVVDLFAGAGGLSLGFELAGASIRAAADNNKAALQTYAFNRPVEYIADLNSARTLMLHADLSSRDERERTFEAVRQKLGGKKPSLLMGGPPCQGFSYAGFRDPTDPRSDLAIAFLDFVEALSPHAVIIENVEGLLTANRGRVFKDIQRTIQDLGYVLSDPWVLAAERFGVPQMRRRVFLVAHRELQFEQPTGFLDRCLGRREPEGTERSASYPVTVEEAISDLPPLVDSDWISSTSPRQSFQNWARGDSRTIPGGETL